ncbi:MAG: NUDIX hydrolase [Deltaproteobacteria bacterium]|uniref:NUDIX hydrolase n=1 Tax=Candidatus Zymogenus saltonus TaxID=2844893 RepID=A0A9D8PIT9_9DELT|nr:NUDIX hydrolase [Candidatus Zymogenus saltonus]
MTSDESGNGYIDIGVGALVGDDGGRLLLVRHKPERGGFWKGRWILPGGMLKLGEEIDSGIVREVKEETGLDVRLDPGTPVVTERIVEDENGVSLHVVYVVKRGFVTGGKLRPASDVGEAIWVDRLDGLDDVLDELHEDTKEILRRFGLVG